MTFSFFLFFLQATFSRSSLDRPMSLSGETSSSSSGSSSTRCPSEGDVAASLGGPPSPEFSDSDTLLELVVRATK